MTSRKVSLETRHCGMQSVRGVRDVQGLGFKGLCFGFGFKGLGLGSASNQEAQRRALVMRLVTELAGVRSEEERWRVWRQVCQQPSKDCVEVGLLGILKAWLEKRPRFRGEALRWLCHCPVEHLPGRASVTWPMYDKPDLGVSNFATHLANPRP